ncbi:MAG: UPF0149 family protein, partial [Pseudomonadota bacterium]|nr:UPF0149 family protein [Pseudomonadota bacterium]
MDYPSYDPKSPNTPLTEEELASLDDLLTNLPADGSMTLDGMDGFLTALLVGPAAIGASSEWLPVIWGGDQEPAPAPFASNQKRKRTTVLVLRHLRSIEAALSGPPDAWEPVFSVAEVPGSQGEELADATDWCMGFLAATDLAPDAWAPLQANPEIGPGLATIAWLGGDVDVAADAEDHPSDEELDDPQVRDQLSR